MSRNLILLIITTAALSLALLTGGKSSFGRVSLALGMPTVANLFFKKPEWRGIALSRLGKFDEAANAFDAVGVKAAYNSGTAYALAGAYPEALEALDRYLVVFPDDAEAIQNFDLIRLYYAGTRIDIDAIGAFGKDREGPEIQAPIARGNARASGTGSESTNSGPTVGLADVTSRGRVGVRKIFDDHFVEADQRWLNSLADVPGEYLQEIIKHEHKRRLASGIAQEESADPW